MSDGAEVVIVGAGTAGASAALALARAGRHPILVDPRDGSAGDRSGAGLLGATDLPTDLRGAFPIDRRLWDRRLLFLGASSSVEVGFQEEGPDGVPASFLRSRSDPWLAGASVAAGAERREGAVGGLLTRGAAVTGVVLDGQPVPAALTILADGPTAGRLADGLSPPRTPSTGVTLLRERLALPSARIEERFGTVSGRGCSLHAILGAGEPSASGFLMTHQDEVTVGVRFAEPVPAERAADRLTDFRSHPSIAPLLAGAAPLDGTRTSAGPFVARRRLVGPGWALCGGAAGLPEFHGAVLRGRNRAVRSGWLAGEAAAGGLGRSANSPAPALGGYPRRLRTEGLLAGDLRSEDPVVGAAGPAARYPELLAAVFHRLMTENGGPKEPVRKAVLAARKASGRGWTSLARDAVGTVRRL